LEYFGLEEESADSLECREHHDAFSWQGYAGLVNIYWWTKWGGSNTCELVSWDTGYQVYFPDDYKKCMCDSWGNGAGSCP
jgi:hypothetical protein